MITTELNKSLNRRARQCEARAELFSLVVVMAVGGFIVRVIGHAIRPHMGDFWQGFSFYIGASTFVGLRIAGEKTSGDGYKSSMDSTEGARWIWMSPIIGFFWTPFAIIHRVWAVFQTWRP
jgi:hypothetical protein